MNAYLLLANGMVFAGQSVGAEGVTVGEVVFATGMVGFQETLTDPSYYGQIITRTFITSQNHGYAVVGDELPAEMGEVAQVNANDGTCEGIKYKKWNCFTVQFHPEANGGPKDTEFLFDRFLNNVKAAKKEAR